MKFYFLSIWFSANGQPFKPDHRVTDIHPFHYVKSISEASGKGYVIKLASYQEITETEFNNFKALYK